MRLNWEPGISLRTHENGGLISDSSENMRELSNALHLPKAAAVTASLIQHKLTIPSVLDLDMRVNKEGEAVNSHDVLIKPNILRFGRTYMARRGRAIYWEPKNGCKVFLGQSFTFKALVFLRIHHLTGGLILSSFASEAAVKNIQELNYQQPLDFSKTINWR
ncbi:hypothetical protein ANO14919_001250 [Xylariales sp. No.14919]|nr:hypothetical protein ANO14919_001250 [Xylariales sp. No.14919]